VFIWLFAWDGIVDAGHIFGWLGVVGALVTYLVLRHRRTA
jgi:hypothetical protein